MSETEPDSPHPAPGADLSGGAPIVAGIGASAGGIEALRAFFEATPPDLGVAWVVVVHLSPEYDSELAEILARSTTMPVAQVTETVPLEGDRVYVIPPDRRLRIDDRHIAALPFDEPRGRRSPVDLFFRSLAEQHGDGFAIILSGGGSDGAVGVRAIKESGGLVLVQDPVEATHDSMPRSAIATGVADLVLPVAELAGRMADLTRTKRRLKTTLGADAPERLEDDDETSLARIFAFVHARTGHDFSRYKRSTVRRRLARRMQVRHTERLQDYLAVLRQNSDEARALFDDLLISVTTFFRDPAAWDALARTVVPHIFDHLDDGAGIRAWVPGCATGEEAYSIAILLLDEAARRDVRPDIQIFASDLDEGALAYARDGRYPAAIAADVSEDRLTRHFTQHDDFFTVSRELRDCVLFASHSLFRDPPFTRLDLVSCRNLLIYLDRDLQEQAYAILHYALKRHGTLFLGSSEIADADYFHAIDKHHNLYRSRDAVGGLPHLLPDAIFAPRPHSTLPVRDRTTRSDARQLHESALEHASPPSILVDADFAVIHLSDNAGRYLRHPGGPLLRDLTLLVRPELQDELRTTLGRAFEEPSAVLSDFVSVLFNGSPVRVAVLIHARPAAPGEPRFALVTFIEGGAATASEPVSVEAGGSADTRSLREELLVMRRSMQAAREKHEATTEELRAANEELQSINEEHRSTAEELETSREELQSMNEELRTVNAELKAKLDEVRRTQSDLENLMAVTEIGILFLDRSLRIARFTSPVADLFHLRAADCGRPIGDFSRRIDYDTFEDDARAVLLTLQPIEREVPVRNGGWSLVRIRPYRTVDDRIDGVVTTFMDISVRKQSELALRTARDYAQRIVDTVREPLVVLTPDLRIQSANSSFYAMFDIEDGTAADTGFLQLEAGLFDIPALRERLGHVIGSDHVFGGFEVGLSSARTGPRTLRLNARRLDPEAILLAIEDVTEAAALEMGQRQLVEQSEHARTEAEAANAVKTNFMATMSHELRTPLNAIIGYAELLLGGIPEPIGPRGMVHAERIQLSSKHLLHLINSMLSFSRIDAGEETISRTPVQLETLLREVAAVIEPLAEKAGVEFHTTVGSVPESVLLDGPKVRQILVNLAMNAVKFTEAGDVTVAVQTTDGVVELAVRDTGIGIPAEDLERIFEPFWQGDSNLTRRAGGTGLGLAIVHRLVTMLDGSIDVDSDLGTGTVFRVRLPLLNPSD